MTTPFQLPKSQTKLTTQTVLNHSDSVGGRLSNGDVTKKSVFPFSIISERFQLDRKTNRVFFKFRSDCAEQKFHPLLL